MVRRVVIFRAALLATALAAAAGWGQAGISEKLARQCRLAIPLEEARGIESRLGQMLIVNVDGFGWKGPLALEPGFVPMMERLQVGGVIPHYGSTDVERIRRTNRALAGMTAQPLLICCDIVSLAAPGPGQGQGRGPARTARFGDGYVGGFIGRFRGLDDADFERLAALNGFVLAGIGINVALGPTVDDSTSDPRTADRARIVIDQLRRFAVQPVIKHFPFLPRGANLHRQSPDTRVALRDVEKRVAIFRSLSSRSDILMTTHLNDNLVDSDMVTFSSAWNRILRSRTGFRGLLMSDGLLMLSHYLTPNDPAEWARRAVLAGHDLLIVEGTAAVSYRVFEGLLAGACANTDPGRRLRERISEATGNIARFKKKHARELEREVNVSAAALARAIALAATDDGVASRPRIDPAAYGELEPDMLRAAAR